MSTDERPDSLAAQAAAWVPPWERQPRPPDRAYQEAAEAEALAEQRARAGAADEEDRSEAGLAADDDDFDTAFEGANPPGYGTPVDEELEPGEPEPGDPEPGDPEPGDPEPGDSEPGGVDEPHPLRENGEPAETGPTDNDPGPELPLPDAVEVATEAAVPEDDEGAPVDAPLPDGDDVSDGAEEDLPSSEEAPPPAPGEDAAVDPAADAPPVGPVQDRGREGSATTRTPEVPSLMADAELAAALEAILLVVDEPVAELQLAQVLEQPTEHVAATLDDISARYTAAGHGFDLRRVAGGWRLYTRPEYAAYVERFVLDGQSVRLTQAALETLAVVAYKQPVTRSRISAIRGVNCDGVMRTLVTRGLIEECGTEPETGAYLYRTTALFLEKLGLNSVDQLPPLAPFLPDDVEEVLDASG